MGFPKTDAAVHEQRIVGLAGTFGDSGSRRRRQFIVAADDKILKSILGVEPGAQSGGLGRYRPVGGSFGLHFLRRGGNWSVIAGDLIFNMGDIRVYGTNRP